MLRIAALQLLNDGGFGLAGRVFQQAVKIEFFVGVFDTLTDTQKMFNRATRSAQRKLDHWIHDRALSQ